MAVDQHQRLSFVLLAILLLAAIIVVRPMLNAILTAAILSYVFYPVHKWLKKKIGHDSLSAFLITIVIILLLVIPSAFVLNTMSREAIEGFRVINGFFSDREGVECEYSAACLAGTAFEKLNLPEELRPRIQQNLGALVALIDDKIKSAIKGLPNFFIQTFVIFFVLYYLLKDGRRLIPKVKHLVPLKKSYQNEFIDRFNRVTYAVVFGTLFVAMLQGLLAGIGFWLAGVDSPLTWGIITFIVSLIPFVGPFVIWLPLSLLLISNGYISGETDIVFKGILLFIYGLIIVSGVDNLIKPKIIGTHAHVHPVLILLGVIGGLSVFGLIGIVVGPVILSLVETALDLITRDRRAKIARP